MSCTDWTTLPGNVYAVVPQAASTLFWKESIEVVQLASQTVDRKEVFRNCILDTTGAVMMPGQAMLAVRASPHSDGIPLGIELKSCRAEDCPASMRSDPSDNIILSRIFLKKSRQEGKWQWATNSNDTNTTRVDAGKGRHKQVFYYITSRSLITYMSLAPFAFAPTVS